ncbi:MAG: hypothetical protein GY936_11055 [Ignavibacteriae bacterium]|nr:hypothetical protein [Ignavibacteriota bacterium]
MKLMFNENATGLDSDTFLFLTNGELDQPNFKIIAETQFSYLGEENFEALQFFVEEANEVLKGV